VTLLNLLLLIFYVLNLALLGYIFIDVANKKLTTYDFQANHLTKSCIYFIIGLAFFTLSSHLLSFFTHSYALSLQICSYTILVCNLLYYSLYAGFDFRKLKASKLEFLYLCIVVFLSFQVYNVDVLKFSSYDKKHHNITACILENDIYPPREPADKLTSMAGYHYGLNLIAAQISHITKVPTWEAHGLEMALFTIIIFVFAPALANIFIKNYGLAIFTGIYAIFFLSFQNFEFLFRFFDLYSKMDFINFFNLYNNISYLVAKNLQTRLYFYSPNLGFALSFVQFFSIIQVLNCLTKNKKLQVQPLILIFAASFLNYFSEVMWHSVLLGFLTYLFFIFFMDIISQNLNMLNYKSWRDNHYQIYGSILISLILGKILCFNQSIVNSGSVKDLIFSPTLSYKQGTGWGATYQELFIGFDKLREYSFSASPSDYYASYDFIVPIFSEMAFREIMLFVYIAIFVFIINKFKEKKLIPIDIVFFSAIATVAIPFFIEYLPRPSEEIRFIIFAKPFLIFYSTFSLLKFLTGRNTNKIIISFLIIILSLNILPSAINLFLGKGSQNHNLTVTKAQKDFVRSFKKIHKTGDICIDDKIYIAWMGESTLAGCYNTGYRTFRENYTTRTTAIRLMNPLLFRELNVDYLVISDFNSLSSTAKERLKNSYWYTQVINDSIKVFKFNKSAQFDQKSFEQLSREYVWALVWETSPTQITILQSSNAQPFISFNRAFLEQQKTIIQQQNKTSNPFLTTWVSVQALPTGNI